MMFDFSSYSIKLLFIIKLLNLSWRWTFSENTRNFLFLSYLTLSETTKIFLSGIKVLDLNAIIVFPSSVTFIFSDLNSICSEKELLI